MDKSSRQKLAVAEATTATVSDKSHNNKSGNYSEHSDYNCIILETSISNNHWWQQSATGGKNAISDGIVYYGLPQAAQKMAAGRGQREKKMQ